jgi:hypothetical protein
LNNHCSSVQLAGLNHKDGLREVPSCALEQFAELEKDRAIPKSTLAFANPSHCAHELDAILARRTAETAMFISQGRAPIVLDAEQAELGLTRLDVC